jgi:hypothetical protein
MKSCRFDGVYGARKMHSECAANIDGRMLPTGKFDVAQMGLCVAQIGGGMAMEN